MMTNDARAESVAAFVEQFADEMGLNPDPAADGPECAAGDLICNILHWVQAETQSRESALEAVRSGISHYITESCIDYEAECVDEVGPDAFVDIEASCDGSIWKSRTAAGSQID